MQCSLDPRPPPALSPAVWGPEPGNETGGMNVLCSSIFLSYLVFNELRNGIWE